MILLLNIEGNRLMLFIKPNLHLCIKNTRLISLFRGTVGLYDLIIIVLYLVDNAADIMLNFVEEGQVGFF